MEHVGIDLGAKHSHVVVISEANEMLVRRKLPTPTLRRWLESRGESRVVMEACTQSPAVARLATEAGHDAVVVPGTVVRALGVGARGIKTDFRDAEVLARASLRNEQLPSVHVRSDVSRSRRELTSARATLVSARRAIASSVKSWLRGRLVTIKGRANTPTFCEAVQRAALEHEEGLPMAIEVLLGTFGHLCQQIERLDQQIESLTSEDEVCERWKQIPGVGPQISFAFIAHVDDPMRFGDADELGSYLALVPGESTTGGKVKRTSTLKAGPLYLKALLVQGAWSMWRARPNEPMVLWARRIAERRGTRIAIVALARKLATVMWSMWKHGTSYDPPRASSARLEPSVETIELAPAKPSEPEKSTSLTCSEPRRTTAAKTTRRRGAAIG